MKIISGGQTGADLGALRGAFFAGVETGGQAPRGYRTERGFELAGLLKEYGLTESKMYGYSHRTEHNVRHSDATLIFAGVPDSPGTQKTIKLCQFYRKPFLLVPYPANLLLVQLLLVDFMMGFEVINVAGNRESVAPGIERYVEECLGTALQELKENDQCLSGR